MTQARLSSILFLSVAALLLSCSGEEDAAPGPSISVSPRAVNLGPGLQQRFTATVEGLDDTSVRWVVVEGDAAGTIDATGLYTAPSTVGTYHVVAISVGDPNRSSSAVINVQASASQARVSLSPESTQIHVAGTVRFTATVTGTANTAVTWSVTEANGGTIDTTGLYTAPTAGGTFHVVATSVAEPDKKATATVVVEDELAVILVEVTPESVELRPGGTQTFTAEVTGTANPAVRWSLEEEGGGTIDTAGRYTAPATEGSFQVVATSVADPSKSASAIVRVRPFSTEGLVMHFAASELLGLQGTLPAAGTPVTSWVDLSGNGRNLTQTDSTRQPVFKTGALNGLPTVSFDGSSTNGDFLRTAALAPALAQPVTIFFVYKAPPVSVNKTLLDAPPGTGANRARIQVTPVPAGALQLYATKFSSPFKAKVTGTFYYATAVFNGVSSRVRANGVEEAPSSSADPGTTGMAGLMLGGRQELNNDAFAATEFAEVLVYDRALDAANLGRVEAYLKNLYFPP